MAGAAIPKRFVTPIAVFSFKSNLYFFLVMSILLYILCGIAFIPELFKEKR